jgi:hypothetical protein
MTSTPHVDMEELKRQLRREVLGDLRPILEAQGRQFIDIGGVMSDEERRSSFASTAAGGRPQEEHQVPDDTTLTMQDAITRRVQWRRTSINVDPSAAASASTTLSHRILLLLRYFL